MKGLPDTDTLVQKVAFNGPSQCDTCLVLWMTIQNSHGQYQLFNQTISTKVLQQIMSFRIVSCVNVKRFLYLQQEPHCMAIRC